MKLILFFVMFVVVINGEFTWEGTWNVTKGCSLQDCCCPAYLSKVVVKRNDANPNSIIVTADWVNGFGSQEDICGKLNLGSGSSYVFPWGLEAANFSGVYDSNGFEYMVNVYGEPDAPTASIRIDQ
mgnify:CR=1 FL=1